jgi:hypothetical protein
MKNKILLLSSLFLLLPVATQCMEQVIAYKPKAMQELQNNRNIFKKRLNECDTFWLFGATSCSSRLFLACTYHQDFHKQTYREKYSHVVALQDVLDEKFFRFSNIDNLKDLSIDVLEILKEIRCDNKQYSALGSASMAENVSLQEKKEFIQKLRKLGFNPTPEDKELALVEQWERWQPMIQNIWLLRCAHNDPAIFLSQVPRDMINYISQRMLDTEESLL